MADLSTESPATDSPEITPQIKKHTKDTTKQNTEPIKKPSKAFKQKEPEESDVDDKEVFLGFGVTFI